jgi:hypothetical protein
MLGPLRQQDLGDALKDSGRVGSEMAFMRGALVSQLDKVCESRCRTTCTRSPVRRKRAGRSQRILYGV